MIKADPNLSANAKFWQTTYHVRVDGLFQPLSLRQLRIEDIFADFLFELVRIAAGRNLGPTNSSEDRFGVLQSALEGGAGGIELPEDEPKRDLVFRWLRAELVRDERTTNRTSEDRKYSLVPLHLAVVECFGRPSGNIPAYGEFLCEMLSAGRPANQETSLLRELWHFFGNSEGDPLSAILELALSPCSDPGQVNASPSWQAPEIKLVRCVDHARKFQKDVENILRFTGVSRRTRLIWLYSLFAFYLATYFLRLAYGAERCAKTIAALVEGSSTTFRSCERCGLTSQGGMGALPCSNFLQISLGERNLDHARLFKRYPYYTSQLAIVRSYLIEVLGETEFESVDSGDKLEKMLKRLGDVVGQDSAQLTTWFELMADTYPIKSDNSRRRKGGSESTKWRLTEADKARAIQLLKEKVSSAFETVVLHLNFEDMALASNNMMEWQFYRSLASDPIYGFARSRGEELQYGLFDGILTAFAHSHVAEVGEEATLQSFENFLMERGLRIDDIYRGQLLTALIDLGLVEDVADSGDAKRLSVPYKLEAA